MSPKHLHRYVDEFAGRHNQRESDTIDQMAAMVQGMDGKRLRYKDLVGTTRLTNQSYESNPAWPVSHATKTV